MTSELGSDGLTEAMLLSYLERVEAHLADLLRDASLRLRMSHDALRGLLSERRFLTAYEVDRDRRWPSELEDRAVVEATLWNGYSDDEAVAAPRPIFGYLLDIEESAPPESSSLIDDLDGYGSAVVTVSTELIEDATLTFGDSMAATAKATEPRIAPSFVSSLHWHSAPLDCMWKLKAELLEVAALDELPSLYTEAQIHTGVDPATLEHVYFRQAPAQDLMDLLESADVEYDIRPAT